MSGDLTRQTILSTVCVADKRHKRRVRMLCPDLASTMPKLSVMLAVGIAFSVGTLLGTYLQLPNTVSQELLYSEMVLGKRSNLENEHYSDFNVRNPRAIRRPSAILDSSERLFSGSLSNGSKTNRISQALKTKPLGKHEPIQTEKLSSDSTLENLDKARDRTRKQREGSGHREGERRPHNGVHPIELTTAIPGETSNGDAVKNTTKWPFSTWNNPGILSNGVYWSSYLEDLTPHGFDDNHVREWMSFARNSSVVEMEDGCGRMQNRLLTFQNGTRTCCRYRQNMDQLQGEVFSYYLSRLLGIKNVPPLALSLVRSSDWQWIKVSSDIPTAEWKENKIVILTEWIDNLTPAFIPKQFRGDDRKMHPTREILENRTLQELIELVQWSDLIVFDYLTANFDRVANNMFNRQWNEFIMDGPTHNLDKIAQDGTLVFYDNESGLLHSYRLLEKYSHFHDSLLNSLCIFRSSTTEAIRRFHERRNVGEALWDLFRQEEPLFREMPRLPRGNVDTLNKRIADVFQQIQKCESLYRKN
ncbi:four-jointed box protein 1-like [Ptychodera flava]|uniref:four-jointed box protein 1-like n=1 Tax=Ptychodera flava TaxID=63121 RepID=UPI00396A2462